MFWGLRSEDFAPTPATPCHFETLTSTVLSASELSLAARLDYDDRRVLTQEYEMPPAHETTQTGDVLARRPEARIRFT